MTNKPLDHESIARAMKEAAWIAKHGTREQRAGRFAPNPERMSEKSTKPEPEQKDCRLAGRPSNEKNHEQREASVPRCSD